MNAALPERITQARELAGLTKTDLSEKLHVSVAAVTQWESGTKNPALENLYSICNVLRVPMSFLLNPIPAEVSRRGPITFRARSAAKTGLLRKQALRLAELVAETFIWLEQWVAFPLPALPDVSQAGGVEQMATQCRRAWGLGDLPITKLGELLESKGIRLCSASFGDVRFDAYSCVMSGRPFTFLGSEKNDKARSRFDAAHELGHLLIHQHFSDEELEDAGRDVEAEADFFASAFLLPAETFSRDVVDTSLDGFKRLKSKWGVSVQAMVRRARDLDLISERTYERHYRSMGAAGWRQAKGEPFDEVVPSVNRSLGKRSLELLSSTGKVNVCELNAALPLPDSVLQSVFDTDVRAMMPAELNKVIVIPDFSQSSLFPDKAELI